jgi:hypothetical protein
MDPATSDGRVIFFVPWEGNTIAGTTDNRHGIPGTACLRKLAGETIMNHGLVKVCDIICYVMCDISSTVTIRRRYNCASQNISWNLVVIVPSYNVADSCRAYSPNRQLSSTQRPARFLLHLTLLPQTFFAIAIF